MVVFSTGGEGVWVAVSCALVAEVLRFSPLGGRGVSLEGLLKV